MIIVFTFTARLSCLHLRMYFSHNCNCNEAFIHVQQIKFIHSQAGLGSPIEIAIEPSGSFAFFSCLNECGIRRIDLTTAAVTIVAGGGSGNVDSIGYSASFQV